MCQFSPYLFRIVSKWSLPLSDELKKLTWLTDIFKISIFFPTRLPCVLYYFFNKKISQLNHKNAPKTLIIQIWIPSPNRETKTKRGRVGEWLKNLRYASNATTTHLIDGEAAHPVWNIHWSLGFWVLMIFLFLWFSLGFLFFIYSIIPLLAKLRKHWRWKVFSFVLVMWFWSQFWTGV